MLTFQSRTLALRRITMGLGAASLVLCGIAAEQVHVMDDRHLASSLVVSCSIN